MPHNRVIHRLETVYDIFDRFDVTRMSDAMLERYKDIIETEYMNIQEELDNRGL